MTQKTSAPTSVLFLGSKEFPFGSNKGEDEIKSGGIESYVEGLASALDKKKVALTIVTRKFAGSEKRERINGAQVVRVPWLNGFYLRNPSFNFFSYLQALKLDCQIIHAHGLVAGLFGWKAARLLGKKLAFTPHGIASGQPQYPKGVSKLLHCMEKFVLKHADAVVFLGEGEQKRFAEHSLFAARPIAIDSGIDLKRFQREKNDGDAQKLIAELGLKGKTVFTFIGRLLQVKGVDYLLEAFPANEQNALLIVGDGPERTKLEEQAKKLASKARIIFLGERRDIPAILAATDVFVLPSLSEGMPITLIEAMASSCAPLVTDIGLPVTSQKDAIVVKKADANELGKALRTLAEEKGLREKIALNALSSSKKFDIAKTAAEHEKLYARLADKK